MDVSDSCQRSPVVDEKTSIQALESPAVIKTNILSFLEFIKENLPENDPNLCKIDSLLEMKNGLDVYCQIAAQVPQLAALYHGKSVRENLFNVQKMAFLMDSTYWNRFKSWNHAYCEEIDAELRKLIYNIYVKLEHDREVDFKMMKDHMNAFKSLHEQTKCDDGIFTTPYYNAGLEEHQKKIEECKRNLYCSACHRRALVMCCFGVGYCSESCQTKDWIIHQARCTRDIFIANCNQQSGAQKEQVELIEDDGMEE